LVTTSFNLSIWVFNQSPTVMKVVGVFVAFFVPLHWDNPMLVVVLVLSF
jgi:hypothetical protein